MILVKLLIILVAGAIGGLLFKLSQTLNEWFKKR